MLCGVVLCRDGIVLVERAEMVNADDIVELIAVTHALYPPFVACLFVIIPVIQWIAP